MALAHLNRLHAHALATLKLSWPELATAQRLAAFLNDRSEAFTVSARTIAQEINQSPKTVEAALIGLVEKGVFERTRSRPRAPYRYTPGAALDCPADCPHLGKSHTTATEQKKLKRAAKEPKALAAVRPPSEGTRPPSEGTRPPSEGALNKELNKEIKRHLTPSGSELVFEKLVSDLATERTAQGLPADLTETQQQTAYGIALELINEYEADGTRKIGNKHRWIAGFMRNDIHRFTPDLAENAPSGLSAAEMTRLSNQVSLTLGNYVERQETETGKTWGGITDISPTEYPQLRKALMVQLKRRGELPDAYLREALEHAREQLPDLTPGGKWEQGATWWHNPTEADLPA